MIEHKYPSQIKILSDSVLLTHLSKLCAPGTIQPQVNQLVEVLYRAFIHTVINQEFPVETAAVPTRMIEAHAEGIWRGTVVDRNTKAIVVNLARAGVFPSHICFNELNTLLNPEGVRQDHISIARHANEKQEVTGSSVSGHKVGGRVDDAIVLIPDPMAATGSSMLETLKLYKDLGRAKKIIAMHCIVTPEYIRAVTKGAPNLIVYALRLDRGLSPVDILKTVPGTYWDKEKGLNAQSYIVPGGGGFGEVMNNSFV